jgi:acetoin utilization deacetylase AcuC-like enzyme/rubrerythrin
MRIIKIIDRLIKLEKSEVMPVLSNDDLKNASTDSHGDCEVAVSVNNEKTEIQCMSMNEAIPMHDCFYACISLTHADGYLEFLKERCATAQSLSKSHIPIKDTAIRTVNSEASHFDLDPNTDVDFTDSDLKAVAETMSNDELPSNYQRKVATKHVTSPRTEILSLKVPLDGDNFGRLGDSPKSKGDGNVNESKSKNPKTKVSKKKDDEKKEEVEEKKVELIWSCPNCTFDNDAILNPKYCEICNHRRPGFTRQQSRGQGQTPRNDNIIDTPRSRSKAETTDRSQKSINSSNNKKIVTWACPLCEFSNEIDNDNCSQCSSPRATSPRTQNNIGFDIHIENSKDSDNLQGSVKMVNTDDVVEMINTDDVSSAAVQQSVECAVECTIDKSEQVHRETKSASIEKTTIIKNIIKSIPSNNDVLILDSRAKRQREIEGKTESKVDESHILDILEMQNVNQRNYVGDKWMGCNDGTVVRGPGFWTELDGDADTYISPESFDAAIHAAFVVCSAVDSIALGVVRGSLLSNSNQNNVEVSNIQNVFCCIRPPGHHAGRFGSTGGCVQNGFCLLNNVAIAAYYARIQYGYRRVAIVDIDAHFGNGTAEIFDGDPHTFYSSIHLQYEGPRDFFYPSTACCIMGADKVCLNNAYVNIYPTKGPGFNINTTEPKLRGREGFRKGFADSIIPALIKFEPDIIFVSAGFDGASSDPVGGQLGLKPADFHWSASLLRKTADDLCGGRLISVLEGGYDITKNTSGLAKAAEAHVLGIAGQPLIQ